MTLQQKIIDSFIGKVVRKDLAFLVKGNLPVPTYVLEYLLGQYCATDDQEQIDAGLQKVKDVITKNYVQRQDAEAIKGMIHDLGRYRIIDNVSVQLNEKDDEYQATFANLGISRVPIGGEYVKQNPKLLTGNGVWCIVTVGYNSGEGIKVRWDIQSLKPIQISNVDAEEYKEQRKNFTTEEWIDFLIHTVGLNPDLLNRREKFIVLSRLLPHVENNFNFMELGPKGTGKSHVFQELSPNGVLVSGGDVTSARLFTQFRGSREVIGLVGYWDVVAWDEFEQQKGRSVEPTLIDIMQNYLANKAFNRGKGTHEASASMCFVGNTKHTVPYMLKSTHLFESIPTSFIKGAFLDRIHLYNPGWEVKILKKESFSKDYGLITDYIAAILHELRKEDYSARLRDYAEFSKTLSERDHNAVRKTFSGMVKLLYPDGNFTEEEAYEIINYAAESRKRVKDQLYVIDDTFREAGVAKFEYTKPNGEVVSVETLERIENPELVEEPVEDEVEDVVEETTASDTTISLGEPIAKRRRFRIPQPKRVEIRENQSGVSYKKLFSDYMHGAKKIIVVDPWLTMGYQITNLLELIQTYREANEDADELRIELHTAAEEGTPSKKNAFNLEKMKEILSSLQSELMLLGVYLDYSFDASHDRYIKFSNGWVADLGHGLDFFCRPDSFTSMTAIRQELNRCRECNITFTRGEEF